MDETVDIRKIPIKNWEGRHVRARVEGRWTTFYQQKTKKQLNSSLPHLIHNTTSERTQLQHQNPSHSLSNRAVAESDEPQYLDQYQLYNLRQKEIERQQEIFIEAKPLPTMTEQTTQMMTPKSRKEGREVIESTSFNKPKTPMLSPLHGKGRAESLNKMGQQLNLGPTATTSGPQQTPPLYSKQQKK